MTSDQLKSQNEELKDENKTLRRDNDDLDGQLQHFESKIRELTNEVCALGLCVLFLCMCVLADLHMCLFLPSYLMGWLDVDVGVFLSALLYLCLPVCLSVDRSI